MKTLIFILISSIFFIGSDMKNTIPHAYQLLQQSHCCEVKVNDTCEKDAKHDHQDCCQDMVCKCACCFHFLAFQPEFIAFQIKSTAIEHRSNHAFVFNYKFSRADYLLHPPTHS